MGNQSRIRGLCRAQLCVHDILGADAIVFHTCGAGDVGQRLKRGTRGAVVAQHAVIGDNADTARAQQTKPRKAVVFQGGGDQGGGGVSPEMGQNPPPLSKKNISINKKSVDKSFLSTLSRVATELVAGLIIGTGLGLLIDNWLETKPLFLIIFFFLGAFAGIYNLWRQLSGNGLKIGYFDKGKKN